MSCLSPKARMLLSRMLVMFQHFFFSVWPSSRTVHRRMCRMCYTSFGDCIDRSGTSLTWLVSWLEVMGSSCSRKRCRSLLGMTRSSYLGQDGTSGGGGILVIYRTTEESLWAERAS